MEIMENKEDPKIVKESRTRDDWLKWKAMINSKLDSLIQRKVFGPIIYAPPNKHLTGYKFVFT